MSKSCHLALPHSYHKSLCLASSQESSHMQPHQIFVLPNGAYRCKRTPLCHWWGSIDDCSHPTCEICAQANIHHSPLPQHPTNCATCLLQCIHCDMCGPLPASYGNFSYFILFINCFSHFISKHATKLFNSSLNSKQLPRPFSKSKSLSIRKK